LEPQDRLILIEKDDQNVEQITMSLIFLPQNGTLTLPQEGDSLLISTLKPFSSEDSFIFTTGNKLLDILPKEKPVITFKLFPNYPNPFNSSTQISFSISGRSTVEIAIFNILGQKVVELTRRKYQPGIHTILWKGINSTNLPVSSGLYFVVMKSDNFYKAQKIILLK
jgi:hypothetical protein